MAARVNTTVYQASHGKRPSGAGHWIIDAQYCNRHSMTRMVEECGGDLSTIVASVEVLSDHTLRFTFRFAKYSDCVSFMRRAFKYDRNAEIIPQP